jgi:hypothetical protein
MTGFDTRIPVRITVGHCDCPIMVARIIEKKVIVVAIYPGERSVWVVRARTSPPKVDSVITSNVYVADGMFQAMLVVFSRCGV